MKRVFAYCAAFLVLVLAGCHSSRYQETDFLGKTATQIVAEHGSFDCVWMPPGEDGLYRNTCCGYTIQEPRVGFLGTDPERLFYISFDENGIAYRCFEDYRPGG